MGILSLLFGQRSRPQEPIDRVLELGIFLDRLSEHTKHLGPGQSTAVGYKISRFLELGAGLARRCGGLSPFDNKTDVIECAAMYMCIQQGALTFLTLQYGPNATKVASAREDFAKIVTYTSATVFDDSVKDPSERGLEIARIGSEITQACQRKNVPLLQKIFDSWDALFNDLTDANGKRLAETYKEAIEWAKKSRGLA